MYIINLFENSDSEGLLTRRLLIRRLGVLFGAFRYLPPCIYIGTCLILLMTDSGGKLILFWYIIIILLNDNAGVIRPAQ